MTSKERHELRYQRRKAAREAKRKEKLDEALDFDKVFTFIHLYRSAQLCYKGVRWKASVQAHRAKCGINVMKRYRELQNGVLKLRKSPEFTIRERGHVRRINSIHIDDRIPQKCNSRYSLKPVLHRTLIYDNYASQENKGTEKARNRVEAALEKHIRHYGLTGGVCVLDVHHFFDSIQHKLVLWVLKKHYTDRRIIGFNMRIVRQYRDQVGLILGSENSQDFAITTPSFLDHYVREGLGVEFYGRYMDDILITDPDYDRLSTVVYDGVKGCTRSLGFELNERKTRMLHFGEQFTFLKRKYDFSESGHIIRRPVRESVVRERRKLKKLRGKCEQGIIQEENCKNSVTSWKSSVKKTKNHKVVTSIDKLYDQLFLYPWLVGKETEVCFTNSSPEGR